MLTSLVWLFLLLPVMVTAVGGNILQHNNNNDMSVNMQLMITLTQMVEKHLAGCHLVLAIPSQNSTLFPHLSRMLSMVSGISLLDGTRLPRVDTKAPRQFRLKRKESGLWSEAQAVCRAILIDFTTYHDVNMIDRIGEWVGLWTQPNTRVLCVGGQEGVDNLLMHSALRNTKHALYISYHNSNVMVWRKCGYCEGGHAGVEVLGKWDNTNSNIISTQHELFTGSDDDLMGHEFRLVENPNFPYMNSERLSDEPGSVLQHQDSLGTRIVTAMAYSFNFTYIVREPIDRTWGIEVEKDKGIWNGIVGTLQREEGDFCLDLTVTPQRALIIPFAGANIDESVLLVSPKPRPLPEFLSLIRPFSYEVWLTVGISILVWGSAVWLLQQIWPQALGGKILDLKSSLLYSLGLMLEDPPNTPPSNLTGQMLVGWWLAACLIITSYYRSLLISHLVVQGKSAVVNTFDDLVEREGWTWGTRRKTGILMTFLSQSTDPVKVKVFEKIETMSVDEGMSRVLDGNFAYLYANYYLKILVATKYTDPSGYTPIHIGNWNFDPYTGNTFGFRPGAPFLRRFRMARQRLKEAGLIDFWMSDVINTRVREDRSKDAATKTSGDGKTINISEGDDQVVLGLQHLLGAFLVLVLGYAVGSIAFLIEQRI